MTAAVLPAGTIGPSSSAVAPVTVEEGTADAWNRYVQAHADATSDHLWPWRSIFEKVFGHETVYLVARRHETVSGVLPLVLFKSHLFGRSVVSLPVLNYGGVLASDDVAADALVEQATAIARDFRATHVEFRHTRRQRPELTVRQHKLMLVRPLPATVDDLWKETDRKVRNQVRKAEKEGLVAVEGGEELLNAFYDVFAENMRDLGTPVYSRRLFAETLAQFQGEARVFAVRQGEQTLAAAMAITFRNTMLVPWASSLRSFRHLCPNMLLYWTMLKRATEEGRARFDFGRSSPDGGTHQFKLQWGAVATPLYWEYVLLRGATAPDHGPTNPRMQRAIDVWKRLPLSVSKIIGPAIVRNIP